MNAFIAVVLVCANGIPQQDCNDVFPSTGLASQRVRPIRRSCPAWKWPEIQSSGRSASGAFLETLAQPHQGPTVAVTHHPPSPLAADAFRDSPGVPWWVPAWKWPEIQSSGRSASGRSSRMVVA
jgi:hypothetical protein